MKLVPDRWWRRIGKEVPNPPHLPPTVTAVACLGCEVARRRTSSPMKPASPRPLRPDQTNLAPGCFVRSARPAMPPLGSLLVVKTVILFDCADNRAHV